MVWPQFCEQWAGLKRGSSAGEKRAGCPASTAENIGDLAIGEARDVAKSKSESLPGRQLG
jgi:hypothetical protein